MHVWKRDSIDFTQLNARGHHVRVIPPYSQEEIMLLAFDTGLRSVDIRALCLEDIDCKRDDEANGQKTRRIFKHLR